MTDLPDIRQDFSRPGANYRESCGRMPLCGLVLVIWVCVLEGISPGAQQLPKEGGGEVFGLTTDLVVLDVSVLDASGRPIPGLRQSDFTITESGVTTRDIAVFVPVVDGVPASTADRSPANGNAASQSPLAGRVMAILLDHTIEGGAPAAAARRVATAAIADLRSQDNAVVISTLPPGATYEFTADRDVLRRSLERAPIGSWLVTNSFEDSQCPCGVCTLNTIRNLASSLQNIAGRKVLLFLGRTLALADLPRSGPGSDCSLITQRATEEMFEAVRVANIVVHAIDPAGVRTPVMYTAERRGLPALGLNVANAEDALRTLADRTGGRAVLSDNRPELAVPELLRHSSTYYLLGFYAGKIDGVDGFRPVEVKVGRDGARVLTRCGYGLERMHTSPARCVTK